MEKAGKYIHHHQQVKWMTLSRTVPPAPSPAPDIARASRSMRTGGLWGAVIPLVRTRLTHHSLSPDASLHPSPPLPPSRDVAGATAPRHGFCSLAMSLGRTMTRPLTGYLTRRPPRRPKACSKATSKNPLYPPLARMAADLAAHGSRSHVGVAYGALYAAELFKKPRSA